MKHNWEYKRLGEFCNFERGVTYSDKDESESPSNNIILRSNNIDLDTYSLNFSELKYLKPEFNISESKKLKANSILICLSNGSLAHLGKTAFIKDDYNMAFGGFMGLIIPKSQNSKYISYIFRSKIYYNFLNSLNRGANIRNIQFSKLSGLVVPVPPMAVQEQIVAELDKINEVIADCRELLRNLNALEQSLFYDFFGDPISNPKAWETKKIEDMCSLKSGDSSANNLPEGDTPYVKVSDMNLDENQYGIKTSSKFVNIGNKTNLLFPIGTTIFPKRGGAILTNKKRLTKVSICCDLNIMGVIPKHINCIYLFYYFVLLDFKELIDGSTVPQINNADIYPLIVPVPPLELQEKFAARIEQIEEQKKAVEQTIAELQTLLDSRMDYWFN